MAFPTARPFDPTSTVQGRTDVMNASATRKVITLGAAMLRLGVLAGGGPSSSRSSGWQHAQLGSVGRISALRGRCGFGLDETERSCGWYHLCHLESGLRE